MKTIMDIRTTGAPCERTVLNPYRSTLCIRSYIGWHIRENTKTKRSISSKLRLHVNVGLSVSDAYIAGRGSSTLGIDKRGAIEPGFLKLRQVCLFKIRLD